MFEQQIMQIQLLYVVCLNVVIDVYMVGCWEEVCVVYEVVLEDDLIELVVLYFYGIWLYQVGCYVEVLDKLEFFSVLEFENVVWYNDLGNVLFVLGELDGVVQVY